LLFSFAWDLVLTDALSEHKEDERNETMDEDPDRSEVACGVLKAPTFF
jgi:hypothetical protein